LFKLAPSSRHPVSSSRPERERTAPPSSLLPVSAEDYNADTQSQLRTSRTERDFEQALRQDGTVRIKESVDVSSLGLDSSQSSPLSTPRNTSFKPSPVPSKNPISSPNAIFGEQEGAERRLNRRSIYRSAGTSSSPDLATLVRKARERGGIVYTPKEKCKESIPPLPPPQDRPTPGNASVRPRSSTSHSLNPLSATLASPSPHKGGREKQTRTALTDVVPEWFMASPRPQNHEPKVFFTLCFEFS
jgi:PH/SEC7 domain-containing protein